MGQWLGRHHLCLSVEDVNASLEFYSGMGFDILKDETKDGWVALRHGNFHLDIYEKQHIPVNMLNFRGGDIPAILPQLINRGITPSKPAQEHNTSWSSELSDPDGNLIFFNTFSDERELESRRGEFEITYIIKPKLPLGRMDICIETQKFEELIEYYKKVGLEPVSNENTHGYIVLCYGNLRLAIYKSSESKFYLNFRGGNVKDIYENLKSKNYDFVMQFTKESDGSDGAGLFDPDGNYIYFNTHPSEVRMLNI